MLKFFDRQVLAEQVRYDIGTHTVEIELMLQGGIPADIRLADKQIPYDDLPEDVKKRLLGLEVINCMYDMNEDKATVTLRGDYNRFVAAGGQQRISSTTTSDSIMVYEAPLDKEVAPVDRAQVQALEEEIEAVEQDLNPSDLYTSDATASTTQPGKDSTIMFTTQPATDSTITGTPNDSETETETAFEDLKDNVALAAKVAASNVALDKMLSILEVKLAEAGVNAAVLQAPATRALIKMALPFLIVVAVDLDPVKNTLPENARAHLRALANSAQLGASIDGMQTMIHLFLPLLADFAAVTASLPAGNTVTMDDVFEDMKVADAAERAE